MAREADGVTAPVQVQVQPARLSGGNGEPKVGDQCSIVGRVTGISQDGDVRLVTVEPEAVYG